MSSLKEKAKTSYAICEKAYLTCEACKHQGKCGSGGCPLVNVLWVRLEDAEQEIEKVRSDLRDAIKTNASTMLATIEKLRNENSELKQKLQQWMKEYEEICQDLETDYVRRCSFLEEKFEELLQEAKP
jgi:DNA repair exonuclease SbcCD ATPase subunit